MPIIARFYEILIKMYFKEHGVPSGNPPHVAIVKNSMKLGISGCKMIHA